MHQWRIEEEIVPLWANQTLYNTYHKLLDIASRPDWAVEVPLRKLAKRMYMSVNTLRKAVAKLAEMGLLRVDMGEGEVSRFELVFGDGEPDLSRLRMGSVSATAQSQALRKEPKPKPEGENLFSGVSKNDTSSVSNFDTKMTRVVSKNDTPTVSNFDTPYIRKQEVTDSKNTTTPLLFPQDDVMADFAVFWAEYPNKKSKQRAIKRWRKGNYRLAEILPVLKRQKQLREWVKADGQFVPRADAYLNQRRWEDALPEGEEYYILDLTNPKTEREKVLFNWLDATNPNLLQNGNQKINSAFEPDRALFEQIVLKCGGNLQRAFDVMRHGWKVGCFTLRAICDRTAAYLDEMKEGKYE